MASDTVETIERYEKIYVKSFAIFEKLLKKLTNEIIEKTGRKLEFISPSKKNDFIRWVQEVTRAEAGIISFCGWDDLTFIIYEPRRWRFRKEVIIGKFYSDGMTKPPRLAIKILDENLEDQKGIIKKYVRKLERIFNIKIICTIT
ncbi:hypothetical protein KY332_04345 [Candidatus Woesearchaeota archaeon]|nr:hypothetical protein [Candidatus Woesearchaeota archaeon]